MLSDNREEFRPFGSAAEPNGFLYKIPDCQRFVLRGFGAFVKIA